MSHAQRVPRVAGAGLTDEGCGTAAFPGSPQGYRLGERFAPRVGKACDRVGDDLGGLCVGDAHEPVEAALGGELGSCCEYDVALLGPRDQR
jgi:hypothetical protein